MNRYFSGERVTSNLVSALPQASFPLLCREVLAQPIPLDLTREQMHALTETDQQKRKQVRYITTCTFQKDPAQRLTENAAKCNLIALDIDTASEAQRLLTQGWDCLGDLAFIVWHTARSTPTSPRIRIVVSAESIPTDRYAAAGRCVGDLLGLTDLHGRLFSFVQPMFLAVTYLGDTDSPIVAANDEGEPFTVQDIIGDEGQADTAQPVTEEAQVDLEVLKTPVDGIGLEDVRPALATLDPDCSMQQWIETGAALKHQFGDEGFELWNEWSARGRKYTTEADTKYRWGTLKQQPAHRLPVTIRSVFKWARSRGWVNEALTKRLFGELAAWISSAERSTEELLDTATRRIAKVCSAVGTLERKSLVTTLHKALKKRSVDLTVKDLTKELRQIEREAMKATGFPPWTKGICYVTADDYFYRYTNDRKFSPQVVDRVYGGLDTGDGEPLRPQDFLLRVVGVPIVENKRYDPSRASEKIFHAEGKPWVNTYQPTYPAPEPDRAAEAGQIFMEHLSNLIFEPEYRRVVLDFLAYLVQHPGRKIRWGILIQGCQGCGKTALHAAMEAVLGHSNVTKVAANKVLKGDWNDWAANVQLCTMEEIRVVGANRHAIMDNLKPLITDDMISVSVKYESHRTVHNLTNYLLFSNYHDSLAVSDGDRRYFVLASPLQRKEQLAKLGGDEYFKRIYGMIRDNPGGLRSWFEQWKISEAFAPDGRAPETNYFRELVESTATPLAAAVKETLADKPHALISDDLVSMKVLREHLSLREVSNFSDQALAHILRELGYTKHSRVDLPEPCPGRHTFWVRGIFSNVRFSALSRLELI